MSVTMEKYLTCIQIRCYTQNKNTYTHDHENEVMTKTQKTHTHKHVVELWSCMNARWIKILINKNYKCLRWMK